MGQRKKDNWTGVDGLKISRGDLPHTQEKAETKPRNSKPTFDATPFQLSRDMMILKSDDQNLSVCPGEMGREMNPHSFQARDMQQY